MSRTAPGCHRERARRVPPRADRRGRLPASAHVRTTARRPAERSPELAGRDDRSVRMEAIDRNKGRHGRRLSDRKRGVERGHRCRRRDRAVELPDGDHAQQARTRARHGQYMRTEARSGYVGNGAAPRPPHRREDRHPRGGRQHRVEPGPSDRRGVDDVARRRSRRLHRIERYGEAHHGGRVRNAQACLSRAGWQVGQHLPRRRRYRRIHGQRRNLVHARRAGVRDPDATARPPATDTTKQSTPQLARSPTGTTAIRPTPTISRVHRSRRSNRTESSTTSRRVERKAPES